MSTIPPRKSFGINKDGRQPHVVPGQRITADLLNALGSQKGIGFLGQGANAISEPGFRVAVRNNSTTVAISAGAPISLESPVLTTDAGLIGQRMFNVLLIEDATVAPVHVAVAVNYIAAGGAGEAYISGMCLAQFTDDNYNYLAVGGLEIIHDSASSGTRYGVVRIGSPRPQSLIIIGGQSLGVFNAITTYGIKKYSGTLASITTQTYDPGTVNSSTGAQTGAPSPAITAWPDGIGFATLKIGEIYSRTIVCNDSRGTMATALIGGASDDTTYAPSVRQVRMLSQRVIGVTKADGTSVSAFSPDIG